MNTENYHTKRVNCYNLFGLEYIYLDYGRAINSFINGEYEKGEKLMRDAIKFIKDRYIKNDKREKVRVDATKFYELFEGRLCYQRDIDKRDIDKRDIEEMKSFVEILDKKDINWKEEIQEKIKLLEEDALQECWEIAIDENGNTIKKEEKPRDREGKI